jgi:hypothetical protein
MRFTVWSYDVWGNETDGFEVNDRCKLGTVEIPDSALTPPASVMSADAFHAWGKASDKAIIAALVEGGYLASARFKFEVEGDDDRIEITHAPTGRPLLGLERAD